VQDKLYQGGYAKCQENILNEMVQEHEAAHLTWADFYVFHWLGDELSRCAHAQPS